MNDRIKELALEARIAYYSKNGSYEGSDDGLSVIPSTQSLEKFAQLIVRECMDCAEWVGKVNTTPVEPINTAHAFKKRIKQHFEVDK